MVDLPRFACVAFDCDSTLSAIEGIDTLCAGLPTEQAEAVAALTHDAMEGVVPLSHAFAKRLEIVRPSREALLELGKRYVEHLVPGARRVVGDLRQRGVSVAIVSGGLAPAVRALARDLGLEDADVYAVDVRFDAAGRYVDFDRSSPLWRSGGKAEVLARLREGRSPLLFVGDGVTDLEAEGVVDRFVGFGGVVRRDPVVRGAERYVLAPSLDFVLREVFPTDPAARGR